MFKGRGHKCQIAALIFTIVPFGTMNALVSSGTGNPPCEIIAAAVISAPSEETSRLVKEEEEKHHK